MSRRPTFDQYFAHRQYQQTLAFTADGARILFSSNISGQFNLWSVPVEGGWPEQLTSFADRTVRSIAVRRRDGTIVFSADEDGDEFHQLFAIEPGAGWPEQWTDAPQVQHFVGPGAWSPDGLELAYAANARTQTDMEVWIRDGGDARAVFGEGMFAVPADWSPDGASLLAVELRSNTDTSIHVIDLGSGETRELTPHEGEAKHVPGPWARDGSGFHLLSDAGREFSALGFHDLASGETSWVEEPDGDVDELAGSPDGLLLAWVENDRGWARVRVRDLDSGELLPEPKLPAGATSVLGSALAFSPDGSRLALVWQEARRPPEVWVVETRTGEARAVTDSRIGRVPDEHLVEPELVAYPADGHHVPAWLYRPAGARPVPAVLAIHGGPEAQERPIYKPLFQYLVSRGIAVLAPNIRGSTGYGKRYQRLIHRDWGGGDLDDFRHAAEWLRAQDWVDEERLGLVGGSYGGFAVLSCATRLPEYWSAAVDIVGPANLVTFARAVPPTWRRIMAGLVGDPETEADWLLERSPITYAEQLRAPLLVIQGAKDPRVVKSESDQLVERLRALGREVAYEVFEDEGHGFTRKSNELHAYRLAAHWLERHLVATAEAPTMEPWPASAPSSRS